MENKIVSFEVAKLAKEKFFNEECQQYYNEGVLKTHPANLYYNHNQDNPPINSYTAPTQIELQQWLKNKHKIKVDSSDEQLYNGLLLIDDNTVNREKIKREFSIAIFNKYGNNITENPIDILPTELILNFIAEYIQTKLQEYKNEY